MAVEVVEEELNFTNVKAFKIAFSDDVKNATAFTKSANVLYNQGKFKEAAASYESALSLWNKCIKAVKSIPETSGDWWSMSNWVLWAPIINYAYVILALVASAKVQSASPSGNRAYTPELQRKLDAAKNGSKSLSKNIIVESLLLMQDFTEDRIRECKAGKKFAFESWNIPIINGYLDAIAECADFDSALPQPTTTNDKQIALEYYVRGYTM